MPENIDRLARSCTESGIGSAVQAASGFVNVWPFGHRFGMSNEHQSPAYIPPIAYVTMLAIFLSAWHWTATVASTD